MDDCRANFLLSYCSELDAYGIYGTCVSEEGILDVFEEC